MLSSHQPCCAFTKMIDACNYMMQSFLAIVRPKPTSFSRFLGHASLLVVKGNIESTHSCLGLLSRTSKGNEAVLTSRALRSVSQEWKKMFQTNHCKYLEIIPWNYLDKASWLNCSMTTYYSTQTGIYSDNMYLGTWIYIFCFRNVN